MNNEKVDLMIWQNFIDAEQLTDQQAQQFRLYADTLGEWNKIHNLTRITSIEGIIQDHFQDAIQLRHFMNFSTIQGLADVGSGAGIPGIPLKIMFPHLFVVLIEVNQKKRTFLEEVCRILNLDQVIVYGSDWRTFLRTTDYFIDVACARASLQISELTRMFKADCIYNNATLVYWASAQWQIEQQEMPFFNTEEWYTLGNKKRRYAFFNK